MKPMLAVQVEDVNALRFPAYVSPKLDGVRALKLNGVLVSRNLKPIPNKGLQELFKDLPEGSDGELIYGDPTADPYRSTVSYVMSEDRFLGQDKVRFWAFDNFKLSLPFKGRFECVVTYKAYPGVEVVPHRLVNSVEELVAAEEEFLAAGYEGAMYRSMTSPYKFGRSTEREAYLLKLKRFKDAEGEIIGTFEYMHNDNVATKNALGRTERSSHLANMRGAGILGGFVVRALNGDFQGAEFRIGTGLTQADREKFWMFRETLVGKVVKFKYFPTGAKDKPRFPVFLGFRDKRDM